MRSSTDARAESKTGVMTHRNGRRRAIRAMPRAAGASPASDALSALTQASDVPPKGGGVLTWSGAVTPRQPIARRG